MTPCYGVPMLILALAVALAQEPAPPAAAPAPTDPMGYLLTAAGAAVAAGVAEHLRSRRSAPAVDEVAALRTEVAALRTDLTPLLTRDPSGALVFLRRTEDIHDAACDLALAVHALARAADATVSRPRPRPRA